MHLQQLETMLRAPDARTSIRTVIVSLPSHVQNAEPNLPVCAKMMCIRHLLKKRNVCCIARNVLATGGI